jgi:hypothetical protein
LEENHPMTISSKFSSYWAYGFRQEDFYVNQSRSPTKMAATVQLRCYWKQVWSRWAITGSWEPLVLYFFLFGDIVLTQINKIKRVGPPDAILEKDHSMTILSKFGSNWATGSRQEDFYVNFP